jgi:hypothetical protein
MISSKIFFGVWCVRKNSNGKKRKLAIAAGIQQRPIAVARFRLYWPKIGQFGQQLADPAGIRSV